jgi:hypothetical protein
MFCNAGRNTNMWNGNLGNRSNTSDGRACLKLWHGEHERTNDYLLQYGTYRHKHERRFRRIRVIYIPVVLSGRSSNSELGITYKLDVHQWTNRYKLNSICNNSEYDLCMLGNTGRHPDLRQWQLGRSKQQ